MKEPIGLKDREGTEIREGDLVEFYFNRNKTPSEVAEDTPGYFRMVDVVEVHGGNSYFVDVDVRGAAHASRFAAVCKVIGNIHEVAVE